MENYVISECIYQKFIAFNHLNIHMLIAYNITIKKNHKIISINRIERYNFREILILHIGSYTHYLF